MLQAFFLYWKWHYTVAPIAFLSFWRDFLIFGMNYFSIPILLKTLFWPWHRYVDVYPRGFDLKEYSSIFVGNMISRVLGAIVRSVVILTGVIIELLIFFVGAFIFVIWWFLPFLSVSFFIIGIVLIISSLQ